MLNLVKNEAIKIYRQTAYKVLVIIVLAIAVLVPTGSFLIEKITSSNNYL